MWCLSVRLSVCLTRSYILSKRKNISSELFHNRVTTPFQFFLTNRQSRSSPPSPSFIPVRSLPSLPFLYSRPFPPLLYFQHIPCRYFLQQIVRCLPFIRTAKRHRCGLTLPTVTEQPRQCWHAHCAFINFNSLQKSNVFSKLSTTNRPNFSKLHVTNFWTSKWPDRFSTITSVSAEAITILAASEWHLMSKRCIGKPETKRCRRPSQVSSEFKVGWLVLLHRISDRKQQVRMTTSSSVPCSSFRSAKGRSSDRSCFSFTLLTCCTSLKIIISCLMHMQTTSRFMVTVSRLMLAILCIRCMQWPGFGMDEGVVG